MKTLVFVAAAAMGLTACQNDFEEQIEAKDSVVVTFVTDSADSRTSVDTSDSTAPVFAWGENETFAVLEQTDALAEATAVTYENVEGKAKITATFDNNAGKESYQYVTVYPATGYVSAEDIEAATLSIPAEQTMAEGSYDPNADLMVSEVVTKDAQPSDAQMVRFTRLAAVAKMSLTNFGVELGDKVQSVTFTADGKTIAGKFTTDLAAPVAENVEGGSSVVVTTTSSSDIYFTLVPTTIAVGESFSVTIVTDKRLYVRKVTIAEGKKPLTFEAGNVTRFSVNMQDVAPSDKWVLVKDVNDLEAGDIVTIAAKNYDYVLSAKYNSTSYPYASYTAVAKFGDYLYHPIATSETSIENRIQHITLAQRDAEKVAFDFYNAKDEYTNDDKSGYYSSTSTNQNFKLQDYPNKNTLFYITITNGETSVVAEESEYDNKYLQYKPASTPTSTSRYFQLRKIADVKSDNAVCIYKLEGAKGTIPVTPAIVTVPDKDEPVVVVEEGATSATPISEVVFNYVGEWNISVSDNAEWLNVSYAEGVVSYTADANTGAKREAKVDITATLEGQENLTWSFNVQQKGAPEEISIADFAKLSKDVNSIYKLTGKVVTLAGNATSSGYFLSDENGNQVEIEYLDTEDGENVWGHNTISIQLGDIMTVTTVPMGSKKGGSSSYPSIYKGHYRLTATVEPTVVGYEGGDATISVALTQNGTLGTLCAPTAIEGNMPASDFATFSYTTDAPTATVKFDANAGASRKVEATFKSGLAEASVVVGQQNDPSVKVGWFLVKDVNELKEGDKVIIAAKNPDETLNYAISSKSSTSGFRPSIAISVTGESIDDVTGVQQYTLLSGHADYAGTWAFKGDSDSKYLYVTSGSLKVTSTLDKNGSWTVEIDSDGKVTLTSKTTSTSNTMMLNWTSSNQTFSVYKSTQTGKGAIYIYKCYNSLEQ